MNPARIIQVIDHLGPGGAQVQLVELVRAIDQNRFPTSVTVLSPQPDKYIPVLRAAGIEVDVIAQRGKADLKALRTLVASFRSRRPAIVQTWLFAADLYGRIAAHLARVPGIVSSVRSVEADKPGHYVWADRILAPGTDRFIVNARAVGARLCEREWVSERRVVTIYNGIDVERLERGDGREWRQRWGFAPDHVVVGYLGRLSPEKRPDLFVSAALRTVGSLPQARFVLVGEGRLRESLAAEIESAGMADRVRLVPFQQQVQDLLGAMDLLVSCSDYEGCSNVILEAMAAGLPVVATDVGGNRELVREDTGWLVPADGADLLASALEVALSERNRLAEFGKLAQRRCRELYSVPTMVRAHEALYADMTGR